MDGGKSIAEEFPRLSRLECNIEANIADRGRWINNNWPWRWSWRHDPRLRPRGELEELEKRLEGWESSKDGKDK